MKLSIINLAVSSWTWHDSFYAGDLHLLQVPEKAKQSNINLVELNDTMLPVGRFSRVQQWVRYALGYQASPKKQRKYRAATIAKLGQELDKHDVECISWAIDSDFTLDHSDWREELAYIITGFQTAQSLKAKYLRFTLGGAAAMGAEVDHIVVSRLKLISSIANKLYPTVKPIVENNFGISANTDRFLSMLSQVPDIGICFDPSKLPQLDEDQTWKKLAAQAELFHLKVYEFDSHQLDKELNYIEVLRCLSENNYDGFIVVACEGEGNPSNVLKLVKQYLKTWSPLVTLAIPDTGSFTVNPVNSDAAPRYNLLSSFGASYSETKS